jgi:molybdopterin/thiamine biosynthesis adenylyltransferase
MSLTEEEILRYSRHIILPEVGGRGQRKLRAASVLIAGLGASGSAAALYLAAAGIGHITLWDPELLGPLDLESGIAHDGTRLGQPRARSAMSAMRAINPDARLDLLDPGSDLLSAVPDHQFLVASVGEWAPMVDASVRSGGTAILCGTHGAGGAVTAVRAGDPCLGCLGADRAQALGLIPEGSGPAVAAAAGVIGTVAATEAVKIILGVGTPLFGRVFSYDGWNGLFEIEPFSKAEGCPHCGQPRT